MTRLRRNNGETFAVKTVVAGGGVVAVAVVGRGESVCRLFS